MALGHLTHERQLVHHPLMHFGYRQLFCAPRDQFGPLLRHDRRNNSGPLQQLDPHSISGIELLPLVAGFAIIHPGIGQNTIDIHRKKTDAFQAGCRDPLRLSFSARRHAG